MADHPMLALVTLHLLNRAQQAGLLDDPAHGRRGRRSR
jgi:hypothetical protein